MGVQNEYLHEIFRTELMLKNSPRCRLHQTLSQDLFAWSVERYLYTLYTIKVFITSLGVDLRPDLRVACNKNSVTSVRYDILKQFCHTSHSSICTD